MAEPLSAFDMARVRWGWGTSSDPAQRQRFAEAGLSPLTSEERMRMERGWGAAPLASKESREAMVAEEVRRGDRPAYQLPEAYGGRPEGTTRRAIRMQKAWDAEQAARIQQEQAMRQEAEFMRQQERNAKVEEREAWRFEKEKRADAANVKLEALTEREAAEEEAEVDAIATGLSAIDFRTDPEAGLKIDQLVLDNPLGAARPDIAKRLDAARRINETYGSAATAKAEQETRKAKAAIINKALSEGVTEAEIEATRFADPQTAVVDYDYGKIERLAAQKEGERKTKEPEEEGYKPIPVSEARDRRDVIQAEFDALSASVEKGELEDDDPDYVKTRARLRKAEAELRVAEQAKPSRAPAQKRPTESSGFQDSLEKLNMINDKLGRDYLDGVKRLGIDNVSDDTIKELLNVTGFNNKNELVSALRDQSALDWANANPDDPRSSRIKQRLGVD